ncbi:hypothetical protein L218DRAFT_461702 [Marasmius fiardii PR-910]|nr:hypothetical protein L218DRAFT_461702 [Marasmius fiardii PR-910]
MLALRRVRFPSSRNLIPSVGNLRRTNATVAMDSTTSTSNSTQTPLPTASAVKTREILLTPTILKPKERRADMLPKSKSKVDKEKEVQKASTSTTAKSTGRKRRHFVQRKRPQISLRNPRKWNRPLREGIVPAYDEALKVIYRDSRMLKKEAKALRDELKGKEQELKATQEGEERDTLDAQLEKMREKLNILEVQSEINLPSVRWTVANAMGACRFPL